MERFPTRLVAARLLFWGAIVALLVVALPLAQAQPAAGGGGDAWLKLYEPHTDADLLYRLMRPHGFDPAKSYPVIVSLHGGGGRGTDNRRNLRNWNRLLAAPAVRQRHPAYVLAPQTTELWDGDDLKTIKALIAALPSVDMSRIYMLGHSMGGHGTFVLLQLDPAYIAAAAPSAGSGLPTTEPFIDPSLIKDIPIWAFHGDKDTVAPYDKAVKLFDEMKKVGANFKMTTWVDDGHSVATKMITGGDNGATKCSSDRCDDESDMLRWLFSHSRDGGE